MIWRVAGKLPKWLLGFVLFVGMTFPFDAEADEWDNTLILGIRQDCPPFAEMDMEDESKSYKGYSVDLCNKIVDSAREELGIKKIEYLGVTAQNRFCKLKSKEVRLLCGATTLTLNGLEQFGASLYTFISGASIMYLPALDRSVNLVKFNVGVLEGTTTSESATIILNTQKDIDITNFPEPNIIRFPSHRDALTRFQNTGEDALHVYIADREILLALNRIASEKKLRLKVSNQYYTVEPYALFMNKDDHALLNVANKTLAKLFKDEIYEIYSNNFPDSRMNITLRNLFQFQQLPVGKPLIGCP